MSTAGVWLWFCQLAGSWYTPQFVSEIHFMDVERTTARVAVIDNKGNSGYVALVQKRDGKWVFVRVLTVWEN